MAKFDSVGQLVTVNGMLHTVCVSEEKAMHIAFLLNAAEAANTFGMSARQAYSRFVALREQVLLAQVA